MRHVAFPVCLLLLTTTLAGCTSGDSQSTNDCWKEIYKTSDSPPGGVIDSNTTYHYDERNLILKEELLWNGEIGERIVYTYDSMSNLVESYRTWGGEFEKITYTYDSDGNEITESIQNSYTFDDDVTIISTYDSSGNLFTVEYDELSDGSIDSRTTYIRDPDGLVLEIHSDEDLDEDYDERDVFHYNSEGQNTRIDRYDDSNSIIGYAVLTYHPSGKREKYLNDWDNDGGYDLTVIWSYDELDRLESHMRDFGSLTLNDTWEYVGDTSDISFKVTNYFDGTGHLDEVSTTYYGCID